MPDKLICTQTTTNFNTELPLTYGKTYKILNEGTSEYHVKNDQGDVGHYPKYCFGKNYPEHEKLRDRKEEHKHIQSFCWFLEANGLLNRIEYHEDEEGIKRAYPRQLGSKGIGDIIAEYFDIDPNKLEQEKVQMLEELTKAQED